MHRSTMARIGGPDDMDFFGVVAMVWLASAAGAARWDVSTAGRARP